MGELGLGPKRKTGGAAGAEVWRGKFSAENYPSPNRKAGSALAPRRVRGEYLEPRKTLRDFMERTREQKILKVY